MEFKVNKILDGVIAELTQINLQIDELFAMGYDQRFELVGNKLMCTATGDIFYARELAVDYLHHVHGVGYMYGVRHRDTDIKGIFVYYTTHTITLN